MVMRSLSVWMNGVAVGVWSVDSKTGGHEFQYENNWLSSEHGRSISFSLPMRPPSAPYRGREGGIVESFFENLLPDSSAIRDRIKNRFSLPSIRAFDLLSRIGRDCVGALQILPDGEVPSNIRLIRGHPVNDEQIENILRDITRPDFIHQDGQSDDEFRISIAGAQEKTALSLFEGKWMIPQGATPTTHIFKLPIGQVKQGIDLSTSVPNEWLSLRILKEYGLPVNEAEIRNFGSQEALIVKRFDRQLSEDRSWIIRLPQEDFCQATGTPPDKKYQDKGGPGIRAISDVLQGSIDPATEKLQFLTTQILFWMLCAIDGHAKNFSIHLMKGNTFSLTPLYDVMSAFPFLGKQANTYSPHKIKMGMAVDGKNRHYRWDEIQYRHWLHTAKLCGLENEVGTAISNLIFKTPQIIEVVSSEITPGFPCQVATSIFKGLQDSANKLDSQRRLHFQSIHNNHNPGAKKS